MIDQHYLRKFASPDSLTEHRHRINQASVVYSLNRKRCRCGAMITAKQAAQQQGSCNRCVRAAA